MSEHNSQLATTINSGNSPKTLKAYIYGLTLSAIFTFIAFGLVGSHAFSAKFTYVSLAILAIAQLAAQVVFFLRLNASREGRWNLMPFLFVIVIVLVLVFGSLWIMYNLNYNMVH